MKKYFLLLSTLSTIYICNAQDTIHKRSGDVIVAKISELSPTEIKYKRFDFQDGPLYVESKSNIKSISYSNGLKETFKEEVEKPIMQAQQGDYYTLVPTNKISQRGNQYLYKNLTFNEKEIHDVLLNTKNREIMTLVTKAKQAKKRQFISFGAIPLGIAGLFAFANSQTFVPGGIQNNTGLMAVGGLCFVAAVACPITGGIANQKRKQYNRQAVKLYNETY